MHPKYMVSLKLSVPICVKPTYSTSPVVKLKTIGSISPDGTISPDDKVARFVMTRKTLAGMGTFRRQLVIIICIELIIVHILDIAPPTTSCNKKLRITLHLVTSFNTSPAVSTLSVTFPGTVCVGIVLLYVLNGAVIG